MRALVARAVGEPLRVEEIDLPSCGPGEVRVEIRAAGVCHSDLSMVDGTLAPPYPLVLGHEAAGLVTEVGDGVDRVAPGDHVVLNWAPPCRQCWYCGHGEPWLCERAGAPATPRGRTPAGEPLHVTLGLGALAEQVVVPQRAVIGVPAELPLEAAALLGCAVLTGVGAVRRTARVSPGDAVAVIGLGGVGLSVVSAARAAGAGQVLAVDVSPAKAALAAATGATDFLLGDDTLNREIRTRTDGRGVDHAFECVGRSATIRTAWRATRRGGQVTVVGMGAKDDVVGLSALDIFHSARTLRSSVYGSSDPDRDVPELARAVLDGTLDLTPLITDRTTLDGAPEAFARMARGEGARTVVLP
ncbi:Zn-dependent alcohol dehydrogenase [Micromonospora sagamiensis]|uniref:S-(Hydroxymethyl)glutathione dehydrogenase/alcohol dehydrogenase n=1 Tax=Micromonospora sagamiensis TaxID=47875 RepID=A0A562WH34_9ACTN|nr:Zn-dependent alcohol dehydrogenase [Micromonospora sagamiensis]TWJ29576.1 S-(hydroxymethyl)glutathione dehydrogenase/alcohol dehydrogenase [Micromonospora sagamiensis]BCL17395.1 alcohol dehydrogenase [Micromonospora sagamiensis]